MYENDHEFNELYELTMQNEMIITSELFELTGSARIAGDSIRVICYKYGICAQPKFV